MRVLHENNSCRRMERERQSESSDMIVDRINVLLSQERAGAYSVRNYLETAQDLGNEPVDDTCRVKMVEWLFAIVDACRLRRNVIPIALSYVDRILSKPGDAYAMSMLRDRNKYQLCVITSLYIAVKINEQQVISPEILEKLSRGKYSANDVEEEERNILFALDWKLNGPTVTDFIEHFLAFFFSSDSRVDEAIVTTVDQIARIQAELSVTDHSFLSTEYSSIALASIYNAMECTGYYSLQEWEQRLMASSPLLMQQLNSSSSISAKLLHLVGESSSGAILPRLSSELVCSASKIPRPSLKRDVSSPASVSALAVCGHN